MSKKGKRIRRKVKISLNPKQQKAILARLSDAQMKKIKMQVSIAQQNGEGINDIIRRVANIIGPISRSLPAKLLKDFVSKLLKQLVTTKGGVMRGGRLNLTLAQKRALIRALPKITKQKITKRIKGGAQRGEGIGAILAAIAKILGPIALEVGPKIISEIVVPLFKRLTQKKKPKGKGLKLPGQGLTPAGGSIRQKKRRRRTMM